MTPLQRAIYTYALEHRWPTPSQDEQRIQDSAREDYDKAWEALLRACPGAFKKVLALEREKNRLTSFELEGAFLAGLSVGLELGAVGRELR